MLSNIGPVQLIIVLVIILLVFGSKKLRNIGGDLGSAVKGFRKAMNDGEVEGKKIEKHEDNTFDDDATKQSTTQNKTKSE